ncbi:hypothetical protein M378DRAFT_169537, partial [Amanita muscaria Koide BX008]
MELQNTACCTLVIGLLRSAARIPSAQCGFDTASNDATGFLKLPIVWFEANSKSPPLDINLDPYINKSDLLAERTLTKQSMESLHPGRALSRASRQNCGVGNDTFIWSRRRSETTFNQANIVV